MFIFERQGKWRGCSSGCTGQCLLAVGALDSFKQELEFVGLACSVKLILWGGLCVRRRKCEEGLGELWFELHITVLGRIMRVGFALG